MKKNKLTCGYLLQDVAYLLGIKYFLMKIRLLFFLQIVMFVTFGSCKREFSVETDQFFVLNNHLPVNLNQALSYDTIIPFSVDTLAIKTLSKRAYFPVVSTDSFTTFVFYKYTNANQNYVTDTSYIQRVSDLYFGYLTPDYYSEFKAQNTDSRVLINILGEYLPNESVWATDTLTFKAGTTSTGLDSIYKVIDSFFVVANNTSVTLANGIVYKACIWLQVRCTQFYVQPLTQIRAPVGTLSTDIWYANDIGIVKVIQNGSRLVSDIELRNYGFMTK
ncbi:MAG: hypothetical protein QM528_08420 [Phycisphaerales bacterium]|nr:hypothetical protein [Phycisphaerales bacterium]